MSKPAVHAPVRVMKASAWLLLLGLWSPGVAPAAESRVDRTVRQLSLEIPPDGLARLRDAPRDLVPATLREGNQVWPRVAVRLKGHRGSFRPVDDHPGFTVILDHFDPAARFHGWRRLHLNNSVEDPSFLHEQLGTHLFRSAGLPAPDTGHAIVSLNGRRLGLYVLKEGFTRDFVARHFARPDGNFYDPELAGDITDPLKRSFGGGPADRSDLARLAAIARDTNIATRWQQLGTVLDRERFLRFLAVENLAGHRDGYGMARNNYRLYHDPATGRFVFLPAGMDVLFGRADYPVQPVEVGLVARAVLETPEGAAGYRREVQTLQTNLFLSAPLTNLVRAWSASLVEHLSAAEARDLARAAADLMHRVDRRCRDLAVQVARPAPVPLNLTNGGIAVPGWRAVDVPAGGALDQAQSPDGQPAWRIRAGPVTAASWRSRVRLAPGPYRFSATATTAGLKPVPFGRTQGVNLSVVGASEVTRPSDVVLKDASNALLALEFRLAAEAEIELVWGCRASAGEAWMPKASPRLERINR